MKVKICGLTRIADIQLCLRLKVDYLGVITEILRSPRNQPLAFARRLFACMQGRGVAVVENPDENLLQALAQVDGLHAVQIHSVSDAKQVVHSKQVLPAHINVWVSLGAPVNPGNDTRTIELLLHLAAQCLDAGAQKLVVDAAVGGKSGGTGQVADLDVLRHVVEVAPQKVMVAGGIGPVNVCQILEKTGATGIDVSSGVERMPGVKDALKIRDLLRNSS